MLALCFIILVVWGFLFWVKEPYADDNISVDLFSGAVLFLSFLVAFLAYQSSRKNDEYKMAEARREYFITDPVLKNIRMLIGHNDIKLQTVVAITNIMEYRTHGILSEEMMKLHEDFDTYLNYMEGVAILDKHGSIRRE